MVVLVTGGTGLVGNALRLRKPDYVYLSSRDCDLRDRQAVESMFEKVRPDIVVHLAAKVGGLYSNMAHNLEYFVDNVRINTNVLEACRKHDVKKVVCCLSTCIFPDNATLPLTESQIHDGPPHPSNVGYAYAKRMLHVQGSLMKDTCTCVVNLIPTNLYGPHDNFDLEHAHVVPALIRKCAESKRDGKPLLIKGDGTARRQFLYSGDLARIIVECIEEVVWSTDLIVTPSHEHSIRELVDTIASALDFRGPVVYDPSFSQGQMQKTASNDRLLTVVPDMEFTSLDEGIRKTVEWYVEKT